MNSKLIYCAQRIAESFDLFSKPITLTHLNRERFTTKIGVFTSVIVYFLIAGYFAYLMITPIKFENSDSATYNWESKILNYKDSVSMNSDLSLPGMFTPFDNSNQTGVSFAINFSPGIDSSVAFIEIYLKHSTGVNSNPTMTKLDISLCNSTLFPFANWTEATNKGIDKFYCFTNNFVSLNNIQDSIEIYAKYCNDTTCKSPLDLTNALFGGFIQFAFIESSSDFYKDLKPNSQFINMENYLLIGPESYSYSEINLKYNKITTTNNKTFSYYSTERATSQIQPMSTTNNIISKTVLKFSSTYNSYSQMQVYYSNPSKRNLEVSKAKDLLFKILFAVSQCGGMSVIIYLLIMI